MTVLAALRSGAGLVTAFVPESLVPHIAEAKRITSHIDWHSYGELILWPYGYTTADRPTDMPAALHRTVRRLARGTYRAEVAPMTITRPRPPTLRRDAR